MKKILPLFLVMMALLSVKAYAQTEKPTVSAESCILYEPTTGTVLTEQDADTPHLIASTTKIMTALVVLENCALTEPVEILPEWTAIEGSSMYLRAGESYTVEELLYGMMLVSGNDAATALACHTSGSVEAFAALMNAKAASLGCENTHFSNACGLDAEDHYASARDLARIASAAMQNESFCRIVSTRCKTVHGEALYNHNKLLGSCEGVIGVKTGYTMAAGRTLVTACERDGLTLLCVTLGDRNDWADHAALYDWGFAEYELVDAADYAGGFTVPVIGGDAAELVSGQSTQALIRRDAARSVRVELPPFIFSGMEKGTELGRVSLYTDGVCVAACPLLLNQELPVMETPLNLAERVMRLARAAGRNIYSF